MLRTFHRFKIIQPDNKRERERERVCVCVLERERERKKGKCYVREKGKRERERERARVTVGGVSARESVKWCCVCIVLCAREECGDRNVVFRYKGM